MSSVSKTERAIKGKFSDEEACALPNLQGRITSLVNHSIKKFKRLSNETELQRLKEICGFQFSYNPVPSTSTAESSAGSTGRPAISVSGPSGNGHDRSFSSRKCVSCRKLRDRLYKFKQLRNEEAEKHAKTVERFRSKLRKKDAVRMMNQKIKRKKIKLATLDEANSSDTVQKYKTKVKSVNRKCSRMKDTQTEKVSSVIDESIKEVTLLKEKLKEKDEQISTLQNNVEILKEQVEWE